MAVPTLSSLPSSFVAGDTVRFAVNDPAYPAALFSLQVVFGANDLSVSAASTGDTFLVELSGEDTKKLKGAYYVTYLFTSGGERQTVKAGKVFVEPDPAVSLEKSFARQALEAVEAAIIKLSSGTNQMVDINGQQFTKKDLNRLMDFRDKLKAEVAAESNEPGSGRGGRLIVTRFCR